MNETLHTMSLLDALARFAMRGSALEQLLRPPHVSQVDSVNHQGNFRRLNFHEDKYEYIATFGLSFKDGGAVNWSMTLVWWGDHWFINGRVVVSLWNAPYQVLLAQLERHVTNDLHACTQAIEQVTAALWTHAGQFLEADDFLSTLKWAASQPTYHGFWTGSDSHEHTP